MRRLVTILKWGVFLGAVGLGIAHWYNLNNDPYYARDMAFMSYFLRDLVGWTAPEEENVKEQLLVLGNRHCDATAPRDTPLWNRCTKEQRLAARRIVAQMRGDVIAGFGEDAKDPLRCLEMMKYRVTYGGQSAYYAANLIDVQRNSRALLREDCPPRR